MKYIRVPEAAKLLGVSRRTLQRWCAERDVPHYKVAGAVLFDPTELEDYVQAHRVEPEGPARVVSVRG